MRWVDREILGPKKYIIENVQKPGEESPEYIDCVKRLLRHPFTHSFITEYVSRKCMETLSQEDERAWKLLQRYPQENEAAA